MKGIYVKTTWIDGKTPVNAANLGKIENALYDLYNNALGVSDFEQGDGISISTGSNGKVNISTSPNVQKSDSVSGIEIVQGDQAEYNPNTVYLVLDTETKLLKKIMFNNISIYEVG